MKKQHIFALLGAAASVASCSQNDFTVKNLSDSQRDNLYLQSWIEHFCVPNPTQDWCMLKPVEARIHVAGTDNVSSVNIYSSSPAEGGKLLAVGKADSSVWFDVNKGTETVFAVVTNSDGEIISGGTYTINDNSVDINGSANDDNSQISRYAHDKSNGQSWFNAMIVCEDMGDPAKSDFDFNDIVLGLHMIGGTNTLQIVPMAAGGTLPANISITIGDITQNAGEIHSLIVENASTEKMLNTYKPFNQAGPSLSFAVPSGWTISRAWADKQIKITINNDDVAYDISSPQAGEAPKMICLGGDWFWPVERISIDSAYPDFTQWAEGGHKTSNLTSWVDNYEDISFVVDWAIDKVADNWFSATTQTEEAYTAKLNGATSVNVPSGAKYFMDPATSTVEMFYNKSDITSVDISGTHFNTGALSNANHMFYGCTNLGPSLDLSSWNTQNLTHAIGIFGDCDNLTEVNLSGWDLTKLIFSGGTWSNCSLGGPAIEKLIVNNAILDYKFSTYQGYGYNGGGCLLMTMRDALTTIEAQNCEYQSSNGEEGVFESCAKLKNVNLKNWTFPNSISLHDMFASCTALETVDLSSWDATNVTSTYQMFSGCSSLTSVNMDGWQTSAIANVGGMFNNCTSLTSIDLSAWDTSSLTNAINIFGGCTNLKTVTIDNWDLTKLTYTGGYYSHCSIGGPVVTTLNFNDAKLDSKFCTYQGYGYNGGGTILMDMRDSLTTVNGERCVYLSSNGECGIFSDCKKLKNVNLKNWSFPNEVSLHDMFNTCTSLETIDLSSWTAENVTSTESMFSGCEKLKEVKMDGWDTSSLTNCNEMFYKCSSLPSIDLSMLNTSNVTKAIALFADCTSLTDVNLSNWDTSKFEFTGGYYSHCDLGGPAVKNLTFDNAILKANFCTYIGYGYAGGGCMLRTMRGSLEKVKADNCTYTAQQYGMFSDCSNLQSAILTNWKLPNSISLADTFYGCRSLTSANLSGWNTVNATSTKQMFFNCESLTDVNLTGWDLSNVTNAANMFYNVPAGLHITCSSSVKTKIESYVPSGTTWTIVD